MRIVNICLGVLVLVVVAVPLFSSDITPYEAGRTLGYIVGAALFGLFFAGVAWFASGRNETAGEVGFGIGLVLIIVVIFSQAGQQITEQKALGGQPSRRTASQPSTASVSMEDPVAFSASVLRYHPYANADPNSDKGRAYAAADEVFQETAEVTMAMVRAGETFADQYMNVVVSATSTRELYEVRQLAIAFREEAERLLDFFSNIRATMDQELAKREVSQRIRKGMLQDFMDSMEGHEQDAVDLAKLHVLLANHMQSLLDILIAEWGNWTADPAQKKILFGEQQAMDSYNTMIGLIQDCVRQMQQKTESI